MTASLDFCKLHRLDLDRVHVDLEWFLYETVLGILNDLGDNSTNRIRFMQSNNAHFFMDRKWDFLNH